MSLAFHLTAYGLRQALDISGGAVVGALQAYFEDPAERLPQALDEANAAAWQVLELALQGRGGVLTRLRALPDRLFTTKGKRALADRIGEFLADQPLALPESGQLQDAEAALVELRQARRRGLLDLDRSRLSDNLPAEVQFLERYADPFGLLRGAHQALAAIADELAGAGLPALAGLLRAQPEHSPPLLVTAFTWFLRRKIAGDPELARGLQFERLQLLASTQERGFDALDQAMQALGGDLRQLTGSLEQLHQTGAEILGLALDIRAEQAAQGQAHRDLYRGVERLLQQLDAERGVASPRLSYSLHSEAEQRAVRALLARFRQLPAAEQERLPALLNGLGKLQLGVGDAAAAEATFLSVEAAADLAAVDDRAARAQAAYNAYRAALERQHWNDAGAHLARVIELDPTLAPFPHAKYQLQAVLGAGGFGVALRCYNRYMDRAVVLKVLYPEQLGREPERVFKEAHILQELHHPAIIGIYNADYAQPAERLGPYLEMECFAGDSLQGYIERHGPLSVDQARRLLSSVVDAMAAVHAKGLLHRDLSPDNLLVRRDGEHWSVRIIDFGLAYRFDAAAARGTSGAGHSVIAQSLTGKWDYAPPEQRGGGRVGPCSDVYSFGKLLCTALSGKPNPLGRSFWNQLPEGLADLLEACVQEDPRERPQGFGEVAKRLAGLEDPPQSDADRSGRPKIKLTHRRGAGRPARPDGQFEPVHVQVDVRKKASYLPSMDPLQPVDLHGWPVGKVQRRQRVTAESLRTRKVLDPQRTRWLDKVSFVNRLDDGSDGPQMLVIPAGSYLMGAGDGESEALDAEKPLHRVTIARPFAIGRYALCFDEFDRFCAATGADRPEDRGWGRGRRPVIQVSAEDLNAYADWLSDRTGCRIRLPSEAEWEYAARAGTTGRFWWGNGITTDQANYNGRDSRYTDNPQGEFREQTLPVDAFDPNPWGLYQVHGNVWERCADCRNDGYDGAPDDGSAWREGHCGRLPERGGQRFRGGSWYDAPWKLRSASRGRYGPGTLVPEVGARLVQDIAL